MISFTEVKVTQIDVSQSYGLIKTKVKSSHFIFQHLSMAAEMRHERRGTKSGRSREASQTITEGNEDDVKLDINLNDEKEKL